MLECLEVAHFRGALTLVGELLLEARRLRDAAHHIEPSDSFRRLDCAIAESPLRCPSSLAPEPRLRPPLPRRRPPSRPATTLQLPLPPSLSPVPIVAAAVVTLAALLDPPVGLLGHGQPPS